MRLVTSLPTRTAVSARTDRLAPVPMLSTAFVVHGDVRARGLERDGRADGTQRRERPLELLSGFDSRLPSGRRLAHSARGLCASVSTRALDRLRHRFARSLRTSRRRQTRLSFSSARRWVTPRATPLLPPTDDLADPSPTHPASFSAFDFGHRSTATLAHPRPANARPRPAPLRCSFPAPPSPSAPRLPELARTVSARGAAPPLVTLAPYVFALPRPLRKSHCERHRKGADRGTRASASGLASSPSPPARPLCLPPLSPPSPPPAGRGASEGWRGSAPAGVRPPVPPLARRSRRRARRGPVRGPSLARPVDVGSFLADVDLCSAGRCCACGRSTSCGGAWPRRPPGRSKLCAAWPRRLRLRLLTT